MKEIVLAHFQRLFGRSNRHIFLENEEGCVKVFLVKLHVGISQLHYRLIYSPIIFRDLK